MCYCVWVRDIGETYGHQQLVSGMALSELDVRQQADAGRGLDHLDHLSFGAFRALGCRFYKLV